MTNDDMQPSLVSCCHFIRILGLTRVATKMLMEPWLVSLLALSSCGFLCTFGVRRLGMYRGTGGYCRLYTGMTTGKWENRTEPQMLWVDLNHISCSNYTVREAIRRNSEVASKISWPKFS